MLVCKTPAHQRLAAHVAVSMRRIISLSIQNQPLKSMPESSDSGIFYASNPAKPGKFTYLCGRKTAKAGYFCYIN
jgi:hypothetical protein